MARHILLLGDSSAAGKYIGFAKQRLKRLVKRVGDGHGTQRLRPDGALITLQVMGSQQRITIQALPFDLLGISRYGALGGSRHGQWTEHATFTLDTAGTASALIPVYVGQRQNIVVDNSGDGHTLHLLTQGRNLSALWSPDGTAANIPTAPVPVATGVGRFALCWTALSGSNLVLRVSTWPGPGEISLPSAPPGKDQTVMGAIYLGSNILLVLAHEYLHTATLTTSVEDAEFNVFGVRIDLGDGSATRLDWSPATAHFRSNARFVDVGSARREPFVWPAFVGGGNALWLWPEAASDLARDQGVRAWHYDDTTRELTSGGLTTAIGDRTALHVAPAGAGRAACVIYTDWLSGADYTDARILLTADSGGSWSDAGVSFPLEEYLLGTLSGIGPGELALPVFERTHPVYAKRTVLHRSDDGGASWARGAVISAVDPWSDGLERWTSYIARAGGAIDPAFPERYGD